MTQTVEPSFFFSPPLFPPGQVPLRPRSNLRRSNGHAFPPPPELRQSRRVICENLRRQHDRAWTRTHWVKAQAAIFPPSFSPPFGPSPSTKNPKLVGPSLLFCTQRKGKKNSPLYKGPSLLPLWDISPTQQPRGSCGHFPLQRKSGSNAARSV